MLIVKGKVPKSIPNCIINTFSEEYEIYLSKAKKPWRTPEGFSLQFDTTLSDLKLCYFIHCGNDEIENLLKKKLNVIEQG